MATDAVFDLCVPILEDQDADEEDKTERVEELLRKETGLIGKELEGATLDILWRHRHASKPAGSSPAVRHTVTRRQSPAPWQASRGGTPVGSSPRSTTASPAPPSGLSARPALLRMRSSQYSPFNSPRPSPRLAHATPFVPQSPSLSARNAFDRTPGPDNFGDYESSDMLFSDDATSNASSGMGSDWGYSGEQQPQLNDMSPYDMLRLVLRDQKTDEEIETILEANGYDLSAAIMSLIDVQGTDPAMLAEQDRTFLVGKSMAAGSRPATPIGQAKSNIICRYWMSTGQCFRADCRFSHDLSGHVCKYWLAGNCLAGDSCVFSHDPSSLMNTLTLSDPNNASTPPSDVFDQSLPVSDLDAFPALTRGSSNPSSGMSSSLRNLYAANDAVTAPPGFASRQALAPEFIPSRPQSRPNSRHESPARHASNLSADDGEAFPTLGSAALRGHKKHHGKRGHGHGHREKDSGNNSLADIVRMSPAPNPVASPRKGFRTRPGYAESREESSAAQAIPAPEHIPWLETGDRANKEYMRARQEAIRHGGARNKFLQSAAQAWNRNDVRAAKALSLRGQSENDLMREAHRLAARHLYDVRNPSSTSSSSSSQETFIDLHGLHPTEAVSYLETALKNQRKASALHRREEGDRSMIVYAIVGTGHHSKGGRDKVGKAIRAYLIECRYAFREFSVAGSAGGGGAAMGGILGIDATSGSAVGAGKVGDEGNGEGEGGESVERGDGSPAMQTGKIRILKAKDVEDAG